MCRYGMPDSQTHCNSPGGPVDLKLQCQIRLSDLREALSADQGPLGQLFFALP
jgi:hypothetical protein